MLDRHRHFSTGIRWALALFVWVAVQAFTPVPDLRGNEWGTEFALASSSIIEFSGGIEVPCPDFSNGDGNAPRGLACALGLLTEAANALGEREGIRQGFDWSRGMLVSAGLLPDREEKRYRVVSVRSSRKESGLPWPVQGSISSSYGMRRHPVLRRRSFHGAIDIRARVGTPVSTPIDGVVRSVCRAGALGRMVRVQCGDTVLTFAHLSGYRVSVGQRVSRGQVVGLVGASGRATGPHLHFAVTMRGRTVNPLTFLARR